MRRDSSRPEKERVLMIASGMNLLLWRNFTIFIKSLSPLMIVPRSRTRKSRVVAEAAGIMTSLRVPGFSELITQEFRVSFLRSPTNWRNYPRKERLVSSHRVGLDFAACRDHESLWRSSRRLEMRFPLSSSRSDTFFPSLNLSTAQQPTKSSRSFSHFFFFRESLVVFLEIND